MTPTPRAAGAVILAALLLGAAACQTDPPEPAPTAVLPTPAPPIGTPSPSSSSTATSERTEFDDALDAYSRAKTALDELYLTGGTTEAPRLLKDHFSGDYLDFVDVALTQYAEEGFQQDGVPEIVGFVSYGRDTEVVDGKTTVEFVACIDYRDVTLTDADGEVIDAGFSVTADTVTMIKSPDRWLADEIASSPASSFKGDCAEVAS